MKRIILILMALAGLSLFVAGCPADSDVIKARLGQEFTLPVGEKASVEGEDLEVRFKMVLSDNRCALGAQCIIAGEVKLILEVWQDGNPDPVELSHPGLFEGLSLEIYGQYKFVFKVLPQPELGKVIGEDDYELILTITKT